MGPGEAACKQSRAGMVGGWSGAVVGEDSGLPGSGARWGPAAGREGDRIKATEIEDWHCVALADTALLSSLRSPGTSARMSVHDLV